MGEVNRKSFTASEKAAVAIEAMKGNLTLNEITTKYGVHATQINCWKKHLKEGVTDIFANGQKKRDDGKNQLIEELYKKIGQLEVELDWLKKKSELFSI